MAYDQIAKKITRELNLEIGSIYVLEIVEKRNLLEFAYPKSLSGNMIPIDRSSLTGGISLSKKPYYSNEFPQEKSLVMMNLLMASESKPIQKKIIYPIVNNGSVERVFLIVRKGSSASKAGADFGNNDLERLKSIVENVSLQQVAESA